MQAQTPTPNGSPEAVACRVLRSYGGASAGDEIHLPPGEFANAKRAGAVMSLADERANLEAAAKAKQSVPARSPEFAAQLQMAKAAGEASRNAIERRRRDDFGALLDEAAKRAAAAVIAELEPRLARLEGRAPQPQPAQQQPQQTRRG